MTMGISLDEIIRERDGRDAELMLSQKSNNDVDNIGLVYKVMDSPLLWLRGDKDLIKAVFNTDYHNIMIFRLSEENYKFRAKLSQVNDFCLQHFTVGHDGFIPDTSDLLSIPDTNILILSREYGFLCKKSDFEKIKSFILSIKLTPDNYSIQELDKVFWTEKTVSLRNDVEFFSKSKKWFEIRDLPYSRSYLLYGPPGNGKTSAIRSIAKYYNATPSQFSFTGRYDDPDSSFNSWILGDHRDRYDQDEDGYRPIPIIREEKTNPRIRILLLEDIDRFFSKEEGFKTPVSFSSVLNALDGVIQRKNSILIATANNPEKIDSQVLCRPGRFDLRIPFEAPSELAMIKFMTKISSNDIVSEEVIGRIASASKGHSFSFLKSIYMSAASKAFARSSDVISDDDMISSSQELLSNMGRDIKSLKGGLGFNA